MEESIWYTFPIPDNMEARFIEDNLDDLRSDFMDKKLVLNDVGDTTVTFIHYPAQADSKDPMSKTKAFMIMKEIFSEEYL